MLYNKDAVKDWKEPEESSEIIISASRNFFRLPENYTRKLADSFNKTTRAKTSLGRLERFCKILELNLPHEEAKTKRFKRNFQGLRTATEVAIQETGHCIELNNFLYSLVDPIFPELSKSKKIVLAKNPRGYSRKYSSGGFGVHSFVKLEVDGRSYLADVVAGTVRREKDLVCSCSQELTESEYISFLLSDCAEDFALNHQRYEDAIPFLNASTILDPNQYPRLFFAAAMRYSQAMENFEDSAKRSDFFKRMEQNLERGISLAPGIMDTWKTAGDFYFDSYRSKKHSLEFYREAVERPSKDKDMARSFYYKLIAMGQKDLAATLRRNNYELLVG